MIIIPRGVAKKAGSKWYCTGKPCKNGHISERFVSTGQCVQCMKERGIESRDENSALSLQHYHDHKHEPLFWAQRTFRAIRARSHRRGLPFDLTEEFVYSCIPVDLKCPVLGITLTFGEKRFSNGGATIDRKIPELGYVRDNIQVISCRANVLKRDVIDASELELVAAYVRSVNKKERNGRHNTNSRPGV